MRQTPWLLGALLGAAALSSWPVPARADTIHLLGGRTLEGTPRLVGDQVSIAGEQGETQVPLAQVSYIERGPSPHEQLRRRLAALDPRDVAATLALADHCREHDLREPEQALLKRVIKLDPNHAEARRRLGFVPSEGGWVASQELARQLEQERAARVAEASAGRSERALLARELDRQNERRAEMFGREKMQRFVDRMNEPRWNMPSRWADPNRGSVYPSTPGVRGCVAFEPRAACPRSVRPHR